MEPEVLSASRGNRSPAVATRALRTVRARAAAMVLVLCTVAAPLPADRQHGFWVELPVETLVDELMAAMTDEELLGQVLLLGYWGSSPSEEILEWIRTRNLGGVKIFGWNAGDLRLLTESIRTMQSVAAGTRHEIPLLVATDQEGGWVRHVKGSTSITPGNMAIGASGLAYDSMESGYFIGLELRDLGINMNFAPTVDVYSNAEAHVIGPRAFSDDPVQTGFLAAAYARGLDRAGVICTAKHFPGHGDADEDSHGALPIIPADLQQLWERDLFPYRMLIKEGLPAVMSGHLGFPKITGDETPASLHPYFQRTLLREKMGFDGIIVTDDLFMNGVRENGEDTATVCIHALKAGNDMIMLSRTPDVFGSTWTRLYELFTTDEEFRSQVLASVRRVLKTKATYLKGEDAVPLMPEVERVERSIPNGDGKSFFFEQACRSVTVIADSRVPFDPLEGERVLLAGQFPDFLDEGVRRYPQADTHLFPYTPFYYSSRAERAELRRKAAGYDTIVFCLANPNGLEMLQELEPLAERVIVYSVLTPVYLRETPWVRSAVAVYGLGVDSFRAGFSVLAGDYAPEGTLPIRLNHDE